jgi:N-6 DNA Methylase
LLTDALVYLSYLFMRAGRDMDPEDIVAALSVGVLKETPPPGHLFETDDNLFTRAASATISGSVVSLTDVKALVNLFQHAKTFGSLIQVPSVLTTQLPQIEQRCREVAHVTSEIASRTAEKFLPVIEQAKILSGRFDSVVANPPYMGGKYLTASLKGYVGKNYPEAKADLYACFIRRNANFAKKNGFIGMITIPNWMFLSSFGELREGIVRHQTVDTFIHNGRGIFGSDFGSCSFVLRNQALPTYQATFRRLFDKPGSVSTNEELESRYDTAKKFYVAPSAFELLPGRVIAYWTSQENATALLRILH